MNMSSCRIELFGCLLMTLSLTADAEVNSNESHALESIAADKSSKTTAAPSAATKPKTGQANETSEEQAPQQADAKSKANQDSNAAQDTASDQAGVTMTSGRTDDPASLDEAGRKTEANPTNSSVEGPSREAPEEIGSTSLPPPPMPIQPSSNPPLWILDDMGQLGGGGPLSIGQKSDPLQLSIGLDMPLHFLMAKSRNVALPPVGQGDLLLRLLQTDKSNRQVWLGLSFRPLGLSSPFPNAESNHIRGYLFQKFFAAHEHRFDSGKVQILAGLLPQHLGYSDALYWATLLPNQRSEANLRQWDNGLSLRAHHEIGSFTTRLQLGALTQRIESPLATPSGLSTSASFHWDNSVSAVSAGIRLIRESTRDERQTNLGWRMKKHSFGEAFGLEYRGEVGTITRPEVDHFAFGALYANHELTLFAYNAYLKTRYDWVDENTYLKYDTGHLVRFALGIPIVQYTEIRLQYNHRWFNSSQRLSTERDDALLLFRLMY